MEGGQWHSRTDKTIQKKYKDYLGTIKPKTVLKFQNKPFKGALFKTAKPMKKKPELLQGVH